MELNTLLTQSSLSDRLQVFRFGAVGAANTVVGYAVIVAGLLMGYGDLIANAAGYAVGLLLSYALNSRWTFAGSLPRKGRFVRYLAVFAAAYSVNLAIVMSARTAGFIDHPLTHLAGLGGYTVLFYIGCARFVFAQSSGSNFSVRALSLRDKWPECLLLCIWIGTYGLLQVIPVSHDVVWQMWIARQMLGGIGLYTEILEINPPLWFWMAVPVEWAAQALSITSSQAILTAVWLYTGASLGALALLIADQDRRSRVLVIGAAALAMMLISLPEFAQREHLALIAAFPYMALIARRVDGGRAGWRLAASIGFIAAVGFALKHYFVLVPLLLELWLIAKRRRSWTPFRPETIVLASCAIAYALAVFAYASDYFTTIVPMIRTAYFGYERPLINLISSPAVMIWIFAGLLIRTGWKHAGSLTVASVLAAAGFFVSYLAQAKGWRYHALPVTGCMFFALATMLSVTDIGRHTRARSAVIVAVMLLPLAITALLGTNTNRQQTVATRLMGGPENRTVLMLTTNPSKIWPAVEDAHRVWPSRHFTFWMVAAVARELRDRGSLSPRLQALANEVRQQTVEDLRCNMADVIIVDNRLRNRYPDLGMLRFFTANRDFKALFEHYRIGETIGNYTAYQREDVWDVQPPATCRTIH